MTKLDALRTEAVKRLGEPESAHAILSMGSVGLPVGVCLRYPEGRNCTVYAGGQVAFHGSAGTIERFMTLWPDAPLVDNPEYKLAKARMLHARGELP